MSASACTSVNAKKTKVGSLPTKWKEPASQLSRWLLVTAFPLSIVHTQTDKMLAVPSPQHSCREAERYNASVTRKDRSSCIWQERTHTTAVPHKINDKPLPLNYHHIILRPMCQLAPLCAYWLLQKSHRDLHFAQHLHVNHYQLSSICL